jgi:hypothetical protein
VSDVGIARRLATSLSQVVLDVEGSIIPNHELENQSDLEIGFW